MMALRRFAPRSPWAEAVTLAAILGLGAPARAAYETQVLTAAEPDNSVDLHLSVGWERSEKRGRITREWLQDGKPLDVKELELSEVTQALIVGARLGVFHDLEIHIKAPIILSYESNIAFGQGVRESSTICCSVNADDPNAAVPRYTITEVPQSRARAGFGDMTFGLSWSPFVDKKDEAWPTITLTADVIAPTGPTRDPADANAVVEASAPDATPGGDMGSGVTTFDLSIAASRRMRQDTPALDPYLGFGAKIPVATPGQQERGMEPPVSGRFWVGTDVVFFEDAETSQKYAIDLSFMTEYVGPGRTFSELSDYLPNFNQTNSAAYPSPYADFGVPTNYNVLMDGQRCGKVVGIPCGELNKVDEFMILKGSIAAHLRFAEFAFIRGGARIEWITDHFLTNERIGKDADPADAVGAVCDGLPDNCVGRVNVRNSEGVDERSKYHDPRYDAPGRRFRLEAATNLVVFVSAFITF